MTALALVLLRLSVKGGEQKPVYSEVVSLFNLYLPIFNDRNQIWQCSF